MNETRQKSNKLRDCATLAVHTNNESLFAVRDVKMSPDGSDPTFDCDRVSGNLSPKCDVLLDEIAILNCLTPTTDKS